MSVVTLTGPPNQKIPRDTYYRIETFGPSVRDGKTLIKEGKCTKSLSQDLDPGKYVVVMKHTHVNDPHTTDFYWYNEFLVDVDEEEWKQLRSMRPKLATTIQSIDGPRWTCPITGCQESTMTPFAMVSHEASHQGYNLEDKDDLKRFLSGDIPLKAKPEAAVRK